MKAKHTPGPWKYEPGGGHAPNRIVGSESIQVSGWPERRNGIGNATYSERICEYLGDSELPGPAANIALIAAAPELLDALECIKSAWEAHDDTPKATKVLLDEVQASFSLIAKAKGE